MQVFKYLKKYISNSLRKILLIYVLIMFSKYVINKFNSFNEDFNINMYL